MNLTEFIESALPLAKHFRGRATEFFTKLAEGGREGAGQRKAFARSLERSFMRWMEGSVNDAMLVSGPNFISGAAPAGGLFFEVGLGVGF